MSLTAQQFERTYNAIQTGNAIIEKRQDGKDWITISMETSQESIFDWLVAEGMAFLGAGKYASPLSVFLSIMSPTTMGTAILPKNDFILKPKEKITMRGDALIKRLFPTPPIVQSGQSKVPTLLMPTPIPKPFVKPPLAKPVTPKPVVTPPIAKPVTPKPVAKQKVAKTVVKPIAAKPVIKPAKPVPKKSAAYIQKQLERDRERQILEERQRKEREKLTSERIKNEREARIQRYRDQEKQRNERDAARRKADDQRQRENRQKEEENRRKALVVSHKKVMENYRAREEARRKADDQRRRDNRKKEEVKKAPQARYITAQKQRQQIGGAYSSVRFFSSTSSARPSLCGDTKGSLIPNMRGTYRK